MRFTQQLLLAGCIAFASCQVSPEKAILKHWTAVDLKGRDHDRFTRNKRPPEFEFKDGKVAFSNNGEVSMVMPYTMATDGKSFVVTDASGRNPLTAKIISLTSDELIITSRIFNNDTVIFHAK